MPQMSMASTSTFITSLLHAYHGIYDGRYTLSLCFTMDNDAFVIEASIGGVRVALSTTNDESFSLKRSASEIDIDFTCFNGTLSIKCPSSSDPPKASSIIRQEEEKDFLIVEVRQESALPKGAEENNDATNGGESLERTHQNEGKNDMIAAQSERTNQQKEKKPPQRKLPERSPRFRGAIDESVLPRFREPNSDVRSTLPASARHDSPGRESLEMSVLPAPMGSCSGLCARLKQSIDREDIIEETEADSVGPGVESSEVHLSELQLACALPRVPARELQAVLDANPQAASETDSEGRYPLHILSENEPLLSTFVRKKGALDFCLNLFEAYPEALIIRDHTGAFPFVYLIQNWVNDAYEYEDDTSSTKPRRQGLVRTLRSKGKLASLFSSDDDEEVHLTHESSFSRVKFPHVVLTRQAQVSFEVLSAFLDHLNESYRQGGFDRDANMLVRAVLAKSIAGIPNLLKTVFLIDDTDKRHWVSCCSIVERIFFCYESTGDWVANMIQRGSVPSRRAVDYLVELSGLTVADHVGPGRSPRSDDYEAYQRDRRKVFAALEASAPLIQSLTVLGNDERGRAATTDVVWQILNHCLSNPLVVGFLLADFVFSIVLLQTFRFVSNTENISLYGVHADATFFGREAKALFLSVSLYFLLRKLSEFYSLLKLSPRAFRSYLKDFWNFIDVAAIGLSLAVVLSQTDSPLFLALAMACLWMKLLGLLRAMNAHLATFILAIIEVRQSALLLLCSRKATTFCSLPSNLSLLSQIVKDIRWFLLVLAIAIFMFADVIHIITVHADNGAYCTSGDAPEDFCQSSVAPVYLKLYAVMVGDVNLEDFSYSRGIDFLFVLFTLMGIIILLNILIAVVGDSYKRSVLNARYLFGR